MGKSHCSCVRMGSDSTNEDYGVMGLLLQRQEKMLWRDRFMILPYGWGGQVESDPTFPHNG